MGRHLWSDEAMPGLPGSQFKVNENYKAINVAAQEKDPSSVLNYYRRLAALRKSDEFKELFTYGRCVSWHMRIQMASWLITVEDEISACWLWQILAVKRHKSGWMAVVKACFCPTQMMLKRALFQWEHLSCLKAVRFWWCSVKQHNLIQY